MRAALEYHHATDVPAGGTDEDEQRFIGDLPHPFKDYRDAERVALEALPGGTLLGDGARVVRSREFPGGVIIHFRAYSSAGGLYPVDAYLATRAGLYWFDALDLSLVRVRDGDARAALADGAADPELPRAGAVVALTGIHARTGWKYLERGYRHIWWDAGTMLANLLALAAADELRPRLLTAFADAHVNTVLGIDGEAEYALALLAIGEDEEGWEELSEPVPAAPHPERKFPLARRLHEASSFANAEPVRAWRQPGGGEEPRLDRAELVRAIRRRGSVRAYERRPLPRDELGSLLDWAEAPIPADAPPVVRELVAVAAVEGLEPGIYDAQLNVLQSREEKELRSAMGFAAMEQDHPRDAAVNVFQLADIDAVVERLGDRGYRWAQLEAGIRAGRVQVGAFMRGWGAAASTFYDDELSRELGTSDAPLLMAAVGPR